MLFACAPWGLGLVSLNTAMSARVFMPGRLGTVVTALAARVHHVHGHEGSDSFELGHSSGLVLLKRKRGSRAGRLRSKSERAERIYVELVLLEISPLVHHSPVSPHAQCTRT